MNCRPCKQSHIIPSTFSLMGSHRLTAANSTMRSSSVLRPVVSRSKVTRGRASCRRPARSVSGVSHTKNSSMDGHDTDILTSATTNVCVTICCLNHSWLSADPSQQQETGVLVHQRAHPDRWWAAPPGLATMLVQQLVGYLLLVAGVRRR